HVRSNVRSALYAGITTTILLPRYMVEPSTGNGSGSYDEGPSAADPALNQGRRDGHGGKAETDHEPQGLAEARSPRRRPPRHAAQKLVAVSHGTIQQPLRPPDHIVI